jgi:hypothetical protein
MTTETAISVLTCGAIETDVATCCLVCWCRCSDKDEGGGSSPPRPTTRPLTSQDASRSSLRAHQAWMHPDQGWVVPGTKPRSLHNSLTSTFAALATWRHGGARPYSGRRPHPSSIPCSATAAPSTHGLQPTDSMGRRTSYFWGSSAGGAARCASCDRSAFAFLADLRPRRLRPAIASLPGRYAGWYRIGLTLAGPAGNSFAGCPFGRAESGRDATREVARLDLVEDRGGWLTVMLRW